MNAEAADEKVLSPTEYLAWERQQPTRHGYLDGEVFAMAGASLAHNRIVANLLRLLGNALLGGPCAPLASDMRVKVPATGLYTYPDVTVVCGRPELEDGDTLLDPRAIVEVLSKTTEAYDRGEKFDHYQTIPSFEEYLLVSQDRPRLDHFARRPDGAWLMRTARAGDTVHLATLGIALILDDIYLGVFDAAAG